MKPFLRKALFLLVPSATLWIGYNLSEFRRYRIPHDPFEYEEFQKELTQQRVANMHLSLRLIQLQKELNAVKISAQTCNHSFRQRSAQYGKDFPK